MSSKSENEVPNRVIVMDNLMNEAFNSRDKEVNSMMNLLITKLSHHNNISVLLVCHELYPKGPSCVLLREHLTGMHLHAVQMRKRPRTTFAITWSTKTKSVSTTNFSRSTYWTLTTALKGKDVVACS